VSIKYSVAFLGMSMCVYVCMCVSLRRRHCETNSTSVPLRQRTHQSTADDTATKVALKVLRAHTHSPLTHPPTHLHTPVHTPSDRDMRFSCKSL